MTLYRLACRLAIASGLAATATLPWVDRSPNNFEGILTVWAIAAALVMVASIVTRFTLPLWLVELAAGVATVIFVTDGMESILSQEQREASIVRTGLFTLTGALIALAVMLDQHRRRVAS